MDFIQPKNTYFRKIAKYYAQLIILFEIIYFLKVIAVKKFSRQYEKI